jgi:hypothetical protein
MASLSLINGTWVLKEDGLTFTTITLDSPSQSDATYNAGSSDPANGTIVIDSGDPGNIDTLDLTLWQGVIDATFDFTAHTHVILECSLTSTPNASYILYYGLFDGNIGVGRGIYGSVTVNNGATGAESMGSTPVNGASADSFQNGGNFTVVHSLDGDSNSTNPSDFGRQSRQENPTNFSGTSLSWFFGIGATTSRAGGTFSGISLKYLAVPSAQ